MDNSEKQTLIEQLLIEREFLLEKEKKLLEENKALREALGFGDGPLRIKDLHEMARKKQEKIERENGRSNKRIS